MVIQNFVCFQAFNNMTQVAYNTSINNFSQNMQLFKDISMIIKHTSEIS